MGKIKVRHMSEVAGVLRWSLQIEDRFYHCALEEDGLLEIRRGAVKSRFLGAQCTR
jgi:hypothetical protein